jgi:hypothetical protein
MRVADEIPLYPGYVHVVPMRRTGTALHTEFPLFLSRSRLPDWTKVLHHALHVLSYWSSTPPTDIQSFFGEALVNSA